MLEESLFCLPKEIMSKAIYSKSLKVKKEFIQR